MKTHHFCLNSAEFTMKESYKSSQLVDFHNIRTCICITVEICMNLYTVAISSIFIGFQSQYPE